MQNSRRGKVFLIGAGPGDPELLTLRALRAIEAADVIVFDRLVSEEVMAMVPRGTRRIDVGKAPHFHAVPQEDIHALLIDLAQKGLEVARLKGGDPLIFGRGGEEAQALRAAGIDVCFIPGITAAQGAAASTGVPLTQRGLASGVRYVTGHRERDMELDLDWTSLASEDTTLVVYMGAASIAQIANQLTRHGLPHSIPVMAVAFATTPRETRLVSTLCQVAADVALAGLRAPVLFIIGHVVSLYAGSSASLSDVLLHETLLASVDA